MSTEIIIGRNLIDYTIESVSSEDANWPAANLLVFDKRIRYWKTTVATDSYVVIDLGAAKALKAVGVIDVNYASCKIQGNDTDSWGSPAFDSDTLTISQEKLTGLYRLHFPEIAGFNYRYLRLFIPTQTPTDGEAVFRTGVLAISVDSEEFIYGIDPGLRMIRNQALTIAEMHGGGQEKALNGAPYASISFDLTRLRLAPEFTQITDQLVSIGETELIMFSPADVLLEETNNGQYCFIMRRQTPPEIAFNQGIDQMSIELREAI